MLKKAIGKIIRCLSDPCGVNKDFDEFGLMSNEKLKLEYSNLLVGHSRSYRFQHLCYFLAVKWIQEN